MIKQSAEVFVVHIPYRGVAPLTNDLANGQLDFGVLVLSSGLPFIQTGKVSAIGVTEARRSPSAPDVPALSENAALRKVNIGVWFGLFGPAKLPDAVTNLLRVAYTDAMNSPELRKKLEETGARPALQSSTPPEKVLANYLKVVLALMQSASIRWRGGGFVSMSLR